MASSTQIVTPSFPVLGVLGLIFITLKLLGEITWSWLWVLAPFWIPVAVVLVIFFGGLIIAGLALLISEAGLKRQRKKKRKAGQARAALRRDLTGK